MGKFLILSFSSKNCSYTQLLRVISETSKNDLMKNKWKFVHVIHMVHALKKQMLQTKTFNQIPLI